MLKNEFLCLKHSTVESLEIKMPKVFSRKTERTRKLSFIKGSLQRIGRHIPENNISIDYENFNSSNMWFTIFPWVNLSLKLFFEFNLKIL